jgi:hypothetical protein
MCLYFFLLLLNFYLIAAVQRLFRIRVSLVKVTLQVIYTTCSFQYQIKSKLIIMLSIANVIINTEREFKEMVIKTQRESELLSWRTIVR